MTCLHLPEQHSSVSRRPTCNRWQMLVCGITRPETPALQVRYLRSKALAYIMRGFFVRSTGQEQVQETHATARETGRSVQAKQKPQRYVQEDEDAGSVNVRYEMRWYLLDFA